MTPKSYIISKIDKLVGLFSYARVKYEHLEMADAHFIEVSPKELFGNDSFRKWEDEVVNAFIEQFPYETVAVIDNESLYTIKNVDYEYSPLEITMSKEPILGDFLFSYNSTAIQEIAIPETISEQRVNGSICSSLKSGVGNLSNQFLQAA